MNVNGTQTTHSDYETSEKLGWSQDYLENVKMERFGQLLKGFDYAQRIHTGTSVRLDAS
jgi:hypothetical protein